MRGTEFSALHSVCLPLRPSIRVSHLNEIHYICRLNISRFSHTRITSPDSTFSVTLYALHLQLCICRSEVKCGRGLHIEIRSVDMTSDIIVNREFGPNFQISFRIRLVADAPNPLQSVANKAVTNTAI